jgi:hypothetical protein
MAESLRKVREETARIIARVEAVAGDHPACFEDGRQWREWLVAAEKCPEGTGPALSVVKRNGGRMMVRGEPDYCADCTKAYRARIVAESRCWPTAAQLERDAADARVAA